jgi:hypothetical protein
MMAKINALEEAGVERTEEEKMAIAEEIVRQLGGRRFIMMTGAYDFLTLDSGVRFKLLGGFTKQGISLIEVILEPSDTYRVRFEATEGRIVSEHESIYNDQLRELFTSETGLDVYL